jgi:uncharacterized Ntn-hydrolase superfamily protein
MRKVLVVCLLFAVVSSLMASDQSRPVRPVNTYSIVCYDPETNQFGAAVQSHWFKVADVIWAEPGVGVVATQSLADFSYGPLGIEMMRYGKSAQEALAGVIASDPNYDVRQVAMIDSYGNVATHTGENCIAEAGHYAGRFYSVQANLMEKSTVWDAMAEAYENSEGDLADRMMAALEAAQAEGGDIRGKQSAAMIVVSGDPSGIEWRDKLVDIRVDDSPEPLVELRRLLNVTRAYNYMNEGDEHIAAGDFDKASEAYGMASDLAEGNPEILFWYAVALVTAEEVEMSLPIFKDVFEMDENWRVLVPRLVESELLPADDGLIELITSQ